MRHSRESHDSRETFVLASHDSRETFARVSHDVRANFNLFNFLQFSLEMVLFMSQSNRICIPYLSHSPDRGN